MVFVVASIVEVLIGFFTIGLSDAFLSDYLTDLKLHSTKKFLSKIVTTRD